ncbi:MAG: hypothetical protein K0Q94_839 [Paenibacillus sp.]|jgi:hypothetical protein|nr:hypothetical protein [Paenibacillus sp.]
MIFSIKKMIVVIIHMIYNFIRMIREGNEL